MNISKQKLKVLIETYLKEDSTNWLGNDPDDFGENLDFLDQPDYKSIYEKYVKMFEEEKEKIKKEILEDKSGQIPEKSRASLSKTLDRIKLVLANIIGNDPGVFAAAFSVIHPHDDVFEPAIDDIKDEDIIAGKKHFDSYKQNRFMNPVIMVVPAEILENIKEMSEDEMRRLISHEIDHIKYAVLQTKFKTLNQSEIRNILRHDFQNKSRQEVAKILLKEKYFTDPEIAFKKVHMHAHYLNVFKAGNVKEKVNIEELAVRINILDRHPKRDEILEKYRNNNINFEEASKFDEQIAHILPFLKREVSLEDIEKVVKIKSDQNVQA